MSASPPSKQPASVGWYVHLPFCRTKCGYCDFYSLPTIEHLIPALVTGLEAELAARNPQRPVTTIFIGGGTPTELPQPALQRLLMHIGAAAGTVDEWTVEANPSSASELKLATLAAAGVSRVSFGAQSFFEDDLRVLERLHDPKHILESVAAAREVGLTDLNLDFIYGVPGQSLERWRETLTRAIDTGVSHLSCYALMFEPGTALTRLQQQGRMTPIDETLEAEMFELTIEMLTAASYEHYEISNFAQPGKQCRANLIYWNNEEYLGIGPSAVSYLNGERRKNVADVRKYVEIAQQDVDALVIEREVLTQEERAAETAVQMLRLTGGIDVARFTLQCGVDPHALFAAPIQEMTAAGLIEVMDERIRLTRRGLLLANYVMRGFLDAVGGADAKDSSFVQIGVDRA